MNKSQKKILIAIATIMVAMFLFPPFHTVWRGSESPAGYGFILSPFNGRDSVDSGLLLAEFLVVLVVGGIAYVLCPEKPSFRLTLLANSPYFNKVKTVFWIVYALIFFVGGLHYHWLPNEEYDIRQHILIASHEAGSRDHPDAWKDKISGEIYRYGDFSKHRESEALRLAVTWFIYVFVGIFVFNYFDSLKFGISLRRAVRQHFGEAVIFSLIAAAWHYVDILYQ